MKVTPEPDTAERVRNVWFVAVLGVVALYVVGFVNGIEASFMVAGGSIGTVLYLKHSVPKVVTDTDNHE